jgi:hypothetical protein
MRQDIKDKTVHSRVLQFGLRDSVEQFDTDFSSMAISLKKVGKQLRKMHDAVSKRVDPRANKAESNRVEPRKESVQRPEGPPELKKQRTKSVFCTKPYAQDLRDIMSRGRKQYAHGRGCLSDISTRVPGVDVSSA